MRRILRHRPSGGTVFGLTALVVAIGGVAFAAIPDTDGTIHGCYSNSTGSLRVVQSATGCRSNETALPWNQQGPPGGGGGASFGEATAEVSTQSDSYVDLGGPSVTINVPASGLVAVFARSEMKAEPAGPGGSAFVGLFDDTDLNPAIGSCSRLNPHTSESGPIPDSRLAASATIPRRAASARRSGKVCSLAGCCSRPLPATGPSGSGTEQHWVRVKPRPSATGNFGSSRWDSSLTRRSASRFRVSRFPPCFGVFFTGTCQGRPTSSRPTAHPPCRPAADMRGRCRRRT